LIDQSLIFVKLIVAKNVTIASCICYIWIGWLCSVDAGFDENDIPLDVIWLDIEHTDGKR